MESVSTGSGIEPPVTSKRVFFEGLNEVRGIAALLVLFHHIELYKNRDHLPSLFDGIFSSFIANAGKNGVYVFFVLSGFLITYLLLVEKTTTGKVDCKRFYIRRVLRIWPVYYVLVFVSFFLIPAAAQRWSSFQGEAHFYGRIQLLENDFFSTLLLFLFFLPNIALVLYPPVVGAAQAWSVGVEEQFYIIWPQLLGRLKARNLTVLFLAIALLPVWKQLGPPIWQAVLELVVTILPIHFMAIGALAALWLFRRPGYRAKAIHLYVAIPVVVLAFCKPLPHLLFGGIVAVTLVTIATGDFPYNLRSRGLSRVGEISYGVYMYHPTLMYLSFSFLHSHTEVARGGLVYNLLAYGLVGSLTLAGSALSYQLMEKRFLRYKSQAFTVVQSVAAVDGGKNID
jgi:peptidoglycan/LPS O-acetylase OafA/YrhL